MITAHSSSGNTEITDGGTPNRTLARTQHEKRLVPLFSTLQSKSYRKISSNS